VVIAIIGLLSSVVFAGLNSARVKARDAKRITEIHQVNTAMQIYFNKYGHYPDPTSTPSIPDGWWKLGTGTSIDDLLINEKSMGQMPTDPLNDAAHYYYYDNNHSCEAVTGTPAVLAIYNLENDVRNNCQEVCGNTWTGDYCIVYEDKYLSN
jgi:type II secretory pathway pseudopilin PulG